MKIIGIDVSTWQGKIDWNQVKNSDVKFAISVPLSVLRILLRWTISLKTITREPKPPGSQ